MPANSVETFRKMSALVAGKAWQTRDGRIINIEDMDDQHLENTIRWLEVRGLSTRTEQGRNPVARTEAMMCGVSDTTQKQYEAMLEERKRRAKLSSPDRTKPGAR